MQFVGTEPNTDTIPLYDEVVGYLKSSIKNDEFVQNDIRYNRKTQSLAGHFAVIRKELLEELKSKSVQVKYLEDWNRIKPGFEFCVKEAIENPDSRRMVAYNTDNYYETFQCFNLIQFVNTGRNEFDMYVYQRSCDVDEKLKDDFIFFANIAQEFYERTNHKITKIVTIFGNVHYEIK